MDFKRREFLKITAATFAAAGLSGCGALDMLANSADPMDPRFGYGRNAKVIPTYCGMCYWKCGVLAHVVEGRVWKLTGNPDDPLSRGRLCPRGTAGTGMLYDPNRLQAPLIRTGDNGEQKWRSASWEDALDRAAELLNGVVERYGPESVAVLYHGKPGDWFAHLGKALGTPNIGKPSDAQCRASRDVAYWLTFGKGLGSPEPLDMENSKVMVLMGSHLGENMHLSQVREFSRLVERANRGQAKLVVVDPRFSIAAGKAWRYLPVKPGTDLALLLAWIHVLLHEGNGTEMFDREYVEQYAHGLPELTEHVKPYTPEWAYRETGIKPALIREVIHALSEQRPNVLLHPGRYNARTGDDTQRLRATAILNALLGSYGREGGFIIPDKPNVPKMSHPPYPKSDRPKVDSGRYLMTATPPMHELVRATLERKPYPIKAWIVAGTNFFHALPHNYWIKAAIGQLDALIVTDILPSEPTGYADVVFSECTYLERHDDLTIKGFKPSYISYRQPVIKPLYDTKPSWWIAKQLGQRMGLGDYFNWFTAEMMIDERLRKAGLAPHKLKQKGVAEFDPGPLFIEQGRTPKFATGTGKIELYSTFLEQAGGEPLPVYRPPEPIKDGYLRLLYGRSPVHSFSRTQNNTYSTDLEPENELWLHPAAAEMQGVGNGDRVFLENQDGVKSTFSIKVRLTQRIRPDCVYMVHGFGSEAKKLSKAYGKGASTNQLQTRVPVDVIMGSTGMSANDVRLLRDRDNAKKEDEAECIGLHETAPSPGGQTGKPLAR